VEKREIEREETKKFSKKKNRLTFLLSLFASKICSTARANALDRARAHASRGVINRADNIDTDTDTDT
jgi:hypothetical protein